MKIEIKEETIKTTTQCKKNFNCLSSEKHIFCKVESCVNGSVHFIKCLDEENCNYRSSFGNSLMCNCPTRKEIFNRYNI